MKEMAALIFEKGYSIQLAESKCMNQLYQGVECSHCIKNCPTDALYMVNDHIYIDSDACLGCGLCISDCPTQAFTSSQWDETTIIKDIEEEAWKTTEFFCGRHTFPYKRDKAKDRGALQIPACLSIVSKGAWFEIGLKTEVEMHTEQCQECAMGKAVSQLEYKVRTAMEWLEAAGHRPKFSMLDLSREGKIKRSLEAIETGLKVTSRRDLFLSLVNKGQQGSEKPKCNLPEKDTENRSTYLPDWQIRLAKVYPENSRERSSPVYWPTIKMSDDCVQCGMCSNFCPSGTLKKVVEVNRCFHSFTSGLCLDCRICQSSCPREAIARERELVNEPFSEQIIQSSTIINCKRCLRVTLDNPQKLCYWCREEAIIADDFHKSCTKLLQDVFQEA